MCNGSMPILPKRLNNLDKFSTYMIVIDTQKGRTEIRWESQPRLKRYLKLCAQNEPEFAELLDEEKRENDVAVFLVNIAVNNPQPPADWEPVHRKLLATECVGAYLEEQCYWAAKKVWEEEQKRLWDEYIYIAKDFVYNADKLFGVLAKYKPQQTKLNTYVKQVLIKTIKNEAEVGKFSDWRLLCQNSEKYLKEALLRAGCQEPQISYLIFVREYFKKVYVLGKVKAQTRKKGETWPQPDDEDFWETATLCNANKQFSLAPHEVTVGLPTLDGQQVEEWLIICIQALRDYPKSINRQYYLEGLQEKSRDPIADKSAISSIEELSSTEGKNRMQQADGTFREEMKAIQARVEKGVQDNILQPSYRKMPELHYGVGLTHPELASIYQVHQSNITRHLLKYYENPLIEKLSGLGQSLDWVKPYVLEWLKKDYSCPLHSDLIQKALVEANAKLESEYQELLILRYGKKMNSQEIARQQGIIESEVDKKIDEAQQSLEKALLKAIGEWCKKYVKPWLKKFYLDEIESAVKSEFSDGSTPTAEMLQDFLLRWIRSTMNISLDKEKELEKIDKLVITLLSKFSE